MQFHSFSITYGEGLVFIIVGEFLLNTKGMFQWNYLLPNYV